jgi:DNA primase catalytic core
MEFSDVLNKLDFFEFVSTKVKLSPSGKNRYRGLSPFTSEKTPSFYIDNEAKTWYCFSSGSGGGVLDYVIKLENVDKAEAIRVIKSHLGITEESDESNEDAQIKKALMVAHKFFLRHQDKAVGYLKTRGFDEAKANEVVKKYEIGFYGQDNLFKYLSVSSFNEAVLKKTGLFYDDFKCRYVNRITIPIKNEYGTVVSFTGRDVTNNARSKYMHGTTTSLFKKSNLLWNFSNVRKMVEEQDRLVVCEGQMDAISITESGIPAVAILGSKISEIQLKSVSKISNNIYMIFDSDNAGEEGLLAAFKMITEMGLEAVFYSVIIPGKKDPDEFIKDNGVDAFKSLIDESTPDTSHIINILVKKNLQKEGANKASVIRKILSDLLPYMKKSYTYRALDMMERLSQELGLSRKELHDWVESGTKFGYGKTTFKKIEEIQIPAPVYERRILYALLKDPNLINKFNGLNLSVYDFESQFVSKIVANIKPGLSTNEILDILKGALTDKEYDKTVAFLAQGLLETDFDTAIDILRAKVKFRSKKAATDFLGRPITATEAEFKRVVGDVVKYEKEPF